MIITSGVFWLFPVAFALHNIEEALWMPAFSQRAGGFHKAVGTFEFLFALIPITFLGVVITLWFCMAGKASLACYLFFAFNLCMLVNVFFPHVAATIVLRRYCPGLATGGVLLAPVTLYLLWLGYGEAYFEVPRLLLATILFAGLMVGLIVLLFRLGRLTQRVFQG